MNAYGFLKRLLIETPSPKNMYIQVMHTGERFRLINFDIERDRLVFLDSKKDRKGLSKSSSFQIINVVSERACVGRINVIARVRRSSQ